MDLREAYEELELDPGSPEPEVRQARNILVKVWHPDRHQNDARLLEVAKVKTARVLDAFATIESAGFPPPSAFVDSKRDEPDASDLLERQLRARELELRERELALKEREAAKPNLGEWVDQKTQAAGEVGKVLLLGLALALLGVVVLGFLFGGV